MHPNWFREYGHGTFYNEILNSAYNQGDPGRYYSEHDGYYKGKEGYSITFGIANKHDVTHQFCSDFDENSNRQCACITSRRAKSRHIQINRIRMIQRQENDSVDDWIRGSHLHARPDRPPIPARRTNLASPLKATR